MLNSAVKLTFQILAATVIFSGLVHAQVIMTSSDLIGEPKEIVEEHKRLAKKVTGIIEMQTDLDVARSWHTYTRKIFGEEYAILIAGAHITAYSIEYSAHEISLDFYKIGRFPGFNQTNLVVRDSSPIKSINDIKNYQALCVNTPNTLSRIQIMHTFENPVSQPRLVEVTGKSENRIQAYLNKRCDAAVINTESLETYNNNATNTEKLRSIYSTEKAPNESILVSKRLTPEQREKLSQYFLSPDFFREFPKLFDYYGHKGSGLVPVTEEEHAPFNRLLRGAVWGW